MDQKPSPTQNAWGSGATRHFFELTPDKVLDAVESVTGFRCTGRLMALNSMENRVFEVEIEMEEAAKPSDRFLICKFYRPGRWSAEAILEEHGFLQELAELEIPVVAPQILQDDSTLMILPEEELFFAIFPKFSGRSPDELNAEQLEQVGRLLARIHNVGAARKAPHRITLTPDSYGRANLNFLLEANVLPASSKEAYRQNVEKICTLSEPIFAQAQSKFHRLHGDCHLGNLLFGREGLFFVDFDDMVNGPAVQDIWLLTPGRDEETLRQREVLIRGYEMMRPFDRNSLRLIEALRALRMIHFSAWIAKRWQDPSFPKAFPSFGTDRYWQEQLRDLNEQISLLQER